jgi:hypothetical protein
MASDFAAAMTAGVSAAMSAAVSAAVLQQWLELRHLLCLYMGLQLYCCYFCCCVCCCFCGREAGAEASALPVIGSDVMPASEFAPLADTVTVSSYWDAAMVAAVFIAGSFAFVAAGASVVSAAVTTVVSVQWTGLLLCLLLFRAEMPAVEAHVTAICLLIYQPVCLLLCLRICYYNCRHNMSRQQLYLLARLLLLWLLPPCG